MGISYLLLRSASKECFRISIVVVGVSAARNWPHGGVSSFLLPFPFRPSRTTSQPPLSTSSTPSILTASAGLRLQQQLQQYLESWYGVRRLMHRRRRASGTATQQVGPGRGGDLGGQLRDPTPPHLHKHSSSSCNSCSFSDTYTLPLLAGAGSLVGMNAST